MHKSFPYIAIFILGAALALAGFTMRDTPKVLTAEQAFSEKTPTVTKANKRADKTPSKVAPQTPTILIHGLGGRYVSEYPMVQPAVRQGIADWGMLISVETNGAMKVKGSLTNKKNPIILLRFENSMAGAVQDAIWLRDVLQLLKTRFHVTRYNLVGHSMGAYAAVYYAQRLSHVKNQPVLNKLVAIAGPFNGIMHLREKWQPMLPRRISKWVNDPANENHLLKNGRPAIIRPQFEALYKTRTDFPSTAHVLNIYGDVDDGSESDTGVTTVSAASLKYLIGDHAASYQQRELHGLDASHYQLHNNNRRVQRLLSWYLWHTKLKSTTAASQKSP